MSDVVRQVREAITQRDLILRGDCVVVGVSGGPDSLCLLHVLRELRGALDLSLYVAHLNHGTRGDASDADAQFVRSVADAWDLPAVIERKDIPALAEEHGLAFEETARRVRYAFLDRVAGRVGARRIAVGHNADDQAETVLMHILRGSGLSGLRGMLSTTPLRDLRLLPPFEEALEPDGSERHRAEREMIPSRGTKTAREERDDARAASLLIRPLLDVPRRAIEAYCAEHDLAPRFDRSNLDTTYFRNRLRHELLPELEAYNPRIKERLRHLAAVAAADYDLLARERQEAWDNVIVEERKDGVVFDQAMWQDLPVSLQRATLRHAAYRLRRSLRDVTFVHVENAREVALEGETGKASTLPMGLELQVGYETLTIGEAGTPGPPPDEPLLWEDDPLPVALPGTTPLPETDWILTARPLERWSMAEVTSPDHPWTAFLDVEALDEPLGLRPRRRGDRMKPLGMGGKHARVSELMINLKIPEAWRDHVPLLTAGATILWLCGRRVSEEARISEATEKVARFRFERAP